MCFEMRLRVKRGKRGSRQGFVVEERSSKLAELKGQSLAFMKNNQKYSNLDR